MGRHTTSDYGVAPDNSDKQTPIFQQHLRYKILNLWIKNSLITDVKHNFRGYKTSYAYNSQDDGAIMLFFWMLMHQYEGGN